MKRNFIPYILLVFIVILTNCCDRKKETAHPDLNQFIDENMQFAQQKVTYFLENLDVNQYPGSMDSVGNLVTLKPNNWQSGFLAGILWYLYEYTGKEKWKIFAQQWTAGLELQKFNTTTHHLGFMLYSSFGHGYKLTQDELYKDVLTIGAKTLVSRYDPDVGCVRSWDDWPGQDADFPVTIDGLLSNELLFYVFRLSGDSSLYNIALEHATVTRTNHIRKDYNSYYCIDYDSETHEPEVIKTWAGYSKESTWSRGHARSFYGFAVTFRETGDPIFLEYARKTAEFYMEHPRLPEDLIPYWDFNDPDIPNAPRDASAAALAASGLLELYSLLPAGEGEKYYQFALKTLHSLSSSNYRNNPNENLGFILKHSTTSKARNLDVDKPKIAADYYFIEALMKVHKLKH